MGVIRGSFYTSLGVTAQSSDDQIRTAARRYLDRTTFEDCPPLMNWLGSEAVRVLTNSEVRAEYDSNLLNDPEANWSTPWPFDIRIAEQGLPPIIKQTFCDRCFGYPSRDVTIPKLRVPQIAVWELSLGSDATQSDPLRGVTPLIKRRCRECGPIEIQRSLRRQSPAVVVLVALSALTFYVGIPFLGVVLLFTPALLLLSFLLGVIRYRLLAPVQRIPKT